MATVERARESVPTRLVKNEGPTVGNRPVGSDPPLRRPVRDRIVLLGVGPPTDRLRGWVVTIVLTMVAAVVRFARLGYPTDAGTPVFDEKHYVPQALQMLRNGGFEDNPGYEVVVHPPLAKQLIALGEMAFGYNGFGWRAASALSGVLIVLLVIRVGRRLTRSTLLGGIAGVLVICEGLSHVQSRMGMLDVFSALFVVAAFATLVRDRDDVRARMAVVMAEGRIGDNDYGPRLGVRWWRLGTGVLIGLGCAVKWSGVYWLVAFALLTVLFDLTARRAAGVRRPWLGTLLRDVVPAVWPLVVVPVLVYLASWWAWFGSETGVDRFGKVRNPNPIIPDALEGLLYYSGKVLTFHSGLTSGQGVHPWESKPWAWPMGLRPMLYHFAGEGQVTGCGADDCVSAVMLLGTPALWWPAYAVLGFAVWRIATRFDWRYAAVVVGYAAGIVPWLINVERQMYFFYMTPAVPFLALATAIVMGEVLGRAGASRERRQTGLLVVGLWTALVVVNFVWLWPILNAVPITQEMWDAQLWLPSWRQ